MSKTEESKGITIKISRELHELLKKLKTGDESFDSYLSRTLKEIENEKTNHN